MVEDTSGTQLDPAVNLDAIMPPQPGAQPPEVPQRANFLPRGS
jgi:hypothetical protein